MMKNRQTPTFAAVLGEALRAEGQADNWSSRRPLPPVPWRPLPAYVTGKGQSLNLRA